jgi:hypothetical protein
MADMVLGPGSLTIGGEGSEIDASCLVNNARVTSDKDEGDSKTMLCGTSKPGKVTYTYSLTGNFDVDADTKDGLFALTQAQPGSQQPFVYVPDSAVGTQAEGTLIIDPLDFGADEYGDSLSSDFEFSLVGAPVYTYPDDSDDDPVARKARKYPPLIVNGRQAGGVTYDTPPTSDDVGEATQGPKSKAKAKTPEPANA